MRIFDSEDYEHIMEKIEFELASCRFSISNAIGRYNNADDVIEYILDYYEDYLFRDDSSAILWLKENTDIVDFYMRRGDLKDCDSIFSLACEAHYLYGKEQLLTVKDEIQERIELYSQADNDDDDDDEY